MTETTEFDEETVNQFTLKNLKEHRNQIVFFSKIIC